MLPHISTNITILETGQCWNMCTPRLEVQEKQTPPVRSGPYLNKTAYCKTSLPLFLPDCSDLISSFAEEQGLLIHMLKTQLNNHLDEPISTFLIAYINHCYPRVYQPIYQSLVCFFFKFSSTMRSVVAHYNLSWTHFTI